MNVNSIIIINIIIIIIIIIIINRVFIVADFGHFGHK